ncbi:MAG: MoaD/ThiS family protein [Actinobacteria bacterium]|nr:MAG: MoaD/ThiS family protein [Actinomycetota bacterium]
MAVEVRIPTILRKHTGGARAVSSRGDTVREVIDTLDAEHPGLKAAIIADAGDIHRFINIYLNDEDIRFSGALETPVSDGDVVSILPAVAGGAASRG